MEILIWKRERCPCFVLASKPRGAFQCASFHPGVLANGPYHSLLLGWVVWTVDAPPAIKSNMPILSHSQTKSLHCFLLSAGCLLCFFRVNVWIMWNLDKKPPVAANDCTRGLPKPLLLCLLSDLPSLSSWRKIIHFYLLYLFLFFMFRNWPLVTGVQSRKRCGFLAVNIWPRTERTCRGSEVRVVVFYLHRYFLTSLYICAVTPWFLGWNQCALNNVISSENEVLCEEREGAGSLLQAWVNPSLLQQVFRPEFMELFRP